MRELPGARLTGFSAFDKEGVLIRQMGTLPATRFTGEKFDDNSAVLIPKNLANLAAIWAFVSADSFRPTVRRIDQALKVTSGSLVAVPFDLAQWQKVAAKNYPNGLPEPQSDDPTQWLFHGHPAGRVPLSGTALPGGGFSDEQDQGKGEETGTKPGATLHIAIARLIGYRWPAELDSPMRLAPEARAWAARCKELERFADDDGVVPLMKTGGGGKEAPADQRIRELLAAAFGRSLSPAELADLLTAAGSPGGNLESWLRNDFFAQHCALFHQRPFVWQIWDGRKDGFSVLVHYHRLCEGNGKGKDLLRKLTYDHLGAWIGVQTRDAKEGKPGADLRVRAAEELQKKLEAILLGEPPFDLFVRWKPLHRQASGWQPDINDGVRMNIRPFVVAGVLRGKVNVKWTSDRGKEPQSIRPREMFPWFWSWDEKTADFAGGKTFAGERFNDLHYTLEHKRAARKQAEEENWDGILARLSGGEGSTARAGSRRGKA